MRSPCRQPVGDQLGDLLLPAGHRRPVSGGSGRGGIVGGPEERGGCPDGQNREGSADRKPNPNAKPPIDDARDHGQCDAGRIAELPDNPIHQKFEITAVNTPPLADGWLAS